MFNLFSAAKYEKRLLTIKDEHFTRISQIENEKHDLELKNKELNIKLETEIDRLENKYKLQVQEIVATNEKEKDKLKHDLDLEKEKFGLKMQETQFKHQEELNRRTLEIERNFHAKLNELVEREGMAKETVVKAQSELLKTFKDCLPNVNMKINEGSPVMKIEADVKT